MPNPRHRGKPPTPVAAASGMPQANQTHPLRRPGQHGHAPQTPSTQTRPGSLDTINGQPLVLEAGQGIPLGSSRRLDGQSLALPSQSPAAS